MKQRIKSVILEDKVAEYIQSEQKENRFLENDILRDLWDIKFINIHIIRVPEREEGEQGIENVIEEIMIENFLSLVKEIDIQTWEVQRVPSKMNSKRPASNWSNKGYDRVPWLFMLLRTSLPSVYQLSCSLLRL